MGNTVRNITININGKQVENSLRGVAQEMTALNRIIFEQKKITLELEREQKRLEQQLRDTPKNALAAQRQLTQELNHVKDALVDQKQSLKELGLEKQKTQDRYRTLSKEINTNSKEVNKNKSSFLALLGSITGITLGATALVSIFQSVVSGTKEFIKGAIQMAKEAKGVEFAFKRLGDEGESAFLRIKESTRGLMTDLDIKRSINEFSNFNISLKETDTLFEFLAVRAAQTGKSVKELQSSLVEGLSKESKLRIDNLGISTADLNAELEKTPDFVQAVANIAKREVAAAGNILDEATNSTDKWNVSLENAQLKLGKLISSNETGLLASFAERVDKIGDSFSVVEAGFAAFKRGLNEILTPLEKMGNTVFPGVNFSIGKFFNALTTPGLTVFGLALNKIGEVLAGTSAAFSTAKNEAVDFVGVLARSGTILLNPLAALREGGEGLKQIYSDLKSSFVDGGKNITDAYKDAVTEFRNFKKEADTILNDVDPTKPLTPEQIKAIEERKRLEEAAAKAREKREADLANFIIRTRERLRIDQLEGFQKEKAQIEARYADELEKAKEFADKYKEIEALKDQEINNLRIEKRLELLEMINDVEEENRLIQKQLAFDRMLEETESEFEKEQIRLKEEEEKALLELETLEERELEKADKLEKAEELKLAIIQKYKSLREQLTAEFDDKEIKQLEAQQKLKAKVKEEELKLLAGVLGVAADLFNQGSGAWKMAKIAETTITTYQAAQGAYESQMALPTPDAPIRAAIAAGIAVAQGLARVNQIAKTKIPDIPKPKATRVKGYFEGGYTGTGAVGYDQDGPVTGYVHQNEWVAPAHMTQSPKYANTIQWLEQERQRTLKGYFTGGPVTSNPENTNPVQQDNSKLQATLDLLMARLNEPIRANILFGYEEEQRRQDIEKDIQNSRNNGIITP
tara:strand:- start:33796 stop:36555 length:2760 start_codon:yes stop_codon:yes gene_type:complete